jgi:hypothetical protein
MIDPEQERLRLAGFYSHQTDGELEQVAQQAEELTEVAREALRAELIRRGVPVESLDRAGDADHSLPEFRDLVTIRSFWGLLEADLAKGLLDAAGIECFLFDGNMVRMDWFNANALGGVKLRVDADNVEAANRVLDEWVSDDPVSDEPGLDS